MRTLYLSIFLLTAYLCLASSAPSFAQTDAMSTTTESNPPASSPSTFDKFVALFRSPSKGPYSDQDKAAQLARDGHYDEALLILGNLYKKNKYNIAVARDYSAVLSWSGRDQDAIDIYEKLPPKEPDYVLAAIGHSYRKIGDIDKALAVYEMGEKESPENVAFIEGEIRCLADRGDYDTALTKADDDIAKNGERQEVVSAKQDIFQSRINDIDQKAISLARAQRYPEALDILANLHTQHPDNVNITRDYLSVLSWSGGHDDTVVTLYESLPIGDEPDYVLAATGVSYRRLVQPGKALDVYKEGLNKYPDNVIFAEGVLRSLSDLHRYEEAVARGNEDIRVHGPRPEIVAAVKDIQRMIPHKRAPKRSKRRHHA